jgi:hypothetical protein
MWTVGNVYLPSLRRALLNKKSGKPYYLQGHSSQIPTSIFEMLVTVSHLSCRCLEITIAKFGWLVLELKNYDSWMTTLLSTSMM